MMKTVLIIHWCFSHCWAVLRTTLSCHSIRKGQGLIVPSVVNRWDFQSYSITFKGSSIKHSSLLLCFYFTFFFLFLYPTLTYILESVSFTSSQWIQRNFFSDGFASNLTRRMRALSVMGISCNVCSACQQLDSIMSQFIALSEVMMAIMYRGNQLQSSAAEWEIPGYRGEKAKESPG